MPLKPKDPFWDNVLHHCDHLAPMEEYYHYCYQVLSEREYVLCSTCMEEHYKRYHKDQDYIIWHEA